MGFLAKEKGTGDFTPVPEGMHHAICYGLYDLGTQYNEKFKKHERKALIAWELPDIRLEIEKEDGTKQNLPKAISKRYTVSLDTKATLRKDLESWRGQRFTPEELKGFDLKKLLAVNCQLQIIHNSADGKTYANITTIVPLSKGMASKTPENPPKYFSFDDGTDVPKNTPEWILEMIQASAEWNENGKAQENEPPPPSWLGEGGQPNDAGGAPPF